MKIIIGKRKHKLYIRDKYKVKISFTQDDYIYTTETIYIERTNPHLDRFLRFLNRCKKAYPFGKGHLEGYTHIKDYDVFCQAGNKEAEKDRNLDELFFEWPFLSTTDAELDAGYGSYDISYYDMDGLEYKVKVKK